MIFVWKVYKGDWQGFSKLQYILLCQHLNTLFIQYIQAKMNNKKMDESKSWKSNQDRYKPISYLLHENIQRPHNGPTFYPIFTHKNSNPEKQSKPPIINRHCSEKSFRKHGMHINKTNYQEPEVRADDEYFPESPTLCREEKSTRHKEKREQVPTLGRIVSFDQKKSEIANYRIKNLKETSSTQSAQNLEISKSTPDFMRTKLTKNRLGQYNYQRMSTPRSNLRRENFKIISKLGEGKFGKVFMVKQISTGFILAMKIIEKKKIIKEGLLEQFIREMRIQSFLEHPNIISLYGFFADETHFYTLMELGCDGQLYSLINNRKALTEEATSFIVKNLLEAISYIHANKVLHRDMKPQNIVIIMGNVKICDFGWAVNKMHPGDLRNTFCGTPLYLSPEIIQGSLYNEKVDLWAIGILAFQLYLGCTPFDITDSTHLYKIVTESIKYPADKQASPEFKEFISAMLSKNPGDRLTSRKLLEMDFITKYKDFETCEELCK